MSRIQDKLQQRANTLKHTELNGLDPAVLIPVWCASVCLCECMLMSLYVWVVFKDKTTCFLIISKEQKTVVNI